MLENNQKEIILLKDLGMQFPTELSKKKVRFGLYKCHCGNEFKTYYSLVINGKTTSCGCIQKQKLILFNKKKAIHNLANHRLYAVWKNIIYRCTNKLNSNYPYYGGRGITVCERWLSIENFIEDMYPSYQEGLSIDRTDNNKGYSKDNCRWSTKAVQARNARKIYKNNIVGYKGVHPRGKRFFAKISVNKKPIHLGTYDTKEQAAKAYDQYVIDNNLEHTINGI